MLHRPVPKPIGCEALGLVWGQLKASDEAMDAGQLKASDEAMDAGQLKASDEAIDAVQLKAAAQLKAEDEELAAIPQSLKIGFRKVQK